MTKYGAKRWNILVETFEILFEAGINVCGVLSLECVPDRSHELYDARHKIFAIGLVPFDFLAKNVNRLSASK